MNSVLTSSLLVALVQLTGAVACNTESSNDGNGGDAPATSPSSPTSSGQQRASGADVGGSRAPVDCAKHLADSESASTRVGFPMKAEPGSWGGVASALRAVPPGATHCGALFFVSKDGSVSRDAGSVVISSALNGDEVRSFYDPVFTNAGCTFAANTAGAYSFSWTCPKALGNALTINLERSIGVFAIGFIAAVP